MPSKTSATGGNSTELGTPTKVLVVCVLTSSWSDISDEEQMGIFARKFIEDVDARSKEMLGNSDYLRNGGWQKIYHFKAEWFICK
jgi:hypothetical protein